MFEPFPSFLSLFLMVGIPPTLAGEFGLDPIVATIGGTDSVSVLIDAANASNYRAAPARWMSAKVELFFEL